VPYPVRWRRATSNTGARSGPTTSTATTRKKARESATVPPPAAVELSRPTTPSRKTAAANAATSTPTTAYERNSQEPLARTAKGMAPRAPPYSASLIGGTGRSGG